MSSCVFWTCPLCESVQRWLSSSEEWKRPVRFSCAVEIILSSVCFARQCVDLMRYCEEPVERKDSQRCQKSIGWGRWTGDASWDVLVLHPPTSEHYCRRRGSTVTWLLTRVQFPLQQSHITAGLFFSFYYDVWVSCANKDNSSASVISHRRLNVRTSNAKHTQLWQFHVQRWVVRAPVRCWKTAILRDVLFMSFETHSDMNRPVQGFRCWRVSEMQMRCWGSKL